MTSQSLNQLPDSNCGTGSDSVPVFNCIVILSQVAATARFKGRIANLADISAEGTAEREVLMALTKRLVDESRGRITTSMGLSGPPSIFQLSIFPVRTS